MKLTPGQKIILASGNKGKIREIQAIMNQHQVISQADFQVPEAEETGLTFVENALIKARNAAACAQLPALADDSGLVVDALSGAPGVYSARYAGSEATDRENLEKLLQALKDIPDHQRSARFICVIVFLLDASDPSPVIAQGSWEGQITTEADGENGFGYDPVFWVPEQQCTSAQLTAEMKNSLSHRGQALRKLMAMLR